MLTLFDYLDPQRTEERRAAQRDDAARYRTAKANARRASTPAAATPLAGERHELLASLAQMWASKELPARETDVLNGCPPDFLMPRISHTRRTLPFPGLGAGMGWVQLTVVSCLLLVGALLITL